MASSNFLSSDLAQAALYVNSAPNARERNFRKTQLHGALYGNSVSIATLLKNPTTRQHKETPMATNSRPATNGTKNAAKQEAARKLIEHARQQEAESKMNAAGEEPSILMQAHVAVNGNRAENYGDQLTNFTNIADRMTITLREKLIAPITPQEVALLMIDVKVARLVKTGGRHKDSIVDIAGYAECLDVINRSTID